MNNAAQNTHRFYPWEADGRRPWHTGRPEAHDFMAAAQWRDQLGYHGNHFTHPIPHLGQPFRLSQPPRTALALAERRNHLTPMGVKCNQPDSNGRHSPTTNEELPFFSFFQGISTISGSAGRENVHLSEQTEET